MKKRTREKTQGWRKAKIEQVGNTVILPIFAFFNFR